MEKHERNRTTSMLTERRTLAAMHGNNTVLWIGVHLSRSSRSTM